MHDASCIGINYAHRFPKCFRSFHTLLVSHIVGLFALHFVSPIQVLSLYQFIQFLTCMRNVCTDSHCENGLVRCCLHTHRRVAADRRQLHLQRHRRRKNRESRTSEVLSKDGKQRVSPFYHVALHVCSFVLHQDWMKNSMIGASFDTSRMALA